MYMWLGGEACKLCERRAICACRAFTVPSLLAEASDSCRGLAYDNGMAIGSSGDLRTDRQLTYGLMS